MSTAGFCVMALMPLCGRGVDYGDCSQDVGCFAAIDDAGSSYSSASELYTWPANKLLLFIPKRRKIDRDLLMAPKEIGSKRSMHRRHANKRK